MDESAETILMQWRQRLEIERSFGLESVVSRSPLASVSAKNKAEAMAALFKTHADCMACPLGTTRTRLVFGAGDPSAQLLFVGEAPGYDEDQQGLPFVGAAGQLLTKIIQAMKLSREAVYIANCLKCRPPQNRNPLPNEILACQPILRAQIDIIQPKVICALGKFAAQTLLNTDQPISRLRGIFHDWHGIKLMATFHPAYLLRNPDDKKLVWHDMQLVMRELGLA